MQFPFGNKRPHSVPLPVLLIPVVAVLVLYLLRILLASSGNATQQSQTSVRIVPTTQQASGDPVIYAVGDIADCEQDNDAKTAALADNPHAAILTLGDNVYDFGSAQEFRDCYDTTWGKLYNRTHPVPGNHEYATRGAEGYFAYFGSHAGESGKGWYSFDLGTWHLIALNSNCSRIDDGCGEDSRQMQWLREDLAKSTKTCTLAYFHHPVFSSGLHGQTETMLPIWKELVRTNVDVVLAGHDHHYERFAPQDAEGVFDGENGAREFVVGTGGRSHYPVIKQQPNSETFNTATFGVLQLTLHPSLYDWQFVPIAGSTFSDRGTGECHEQKLL